MSFDTRITSSCTKVDFFNRYWGFLEANGVFSAILHGWQDYPNTILSDVDYCVPQEQLPNLLNLLARYCEDVGWSIVQIFQHEATAFYCVCASKDNIDDVVLLDVCGDYWVHGKLRITSNDLLEGRRRVEGYEFYVLSPHVELAYIITKAVIKKKNPEVIRERMDELILEAGSQIKNMLPILPESELFSLSEFCSNPSECLQNSKWAAKLVRVRSLGAGEIKRLINRLLRPSGYIIQISGDESDAKRIADRLTSFLSGTYRKDLVINNRSGIRVLFEMLKGKFKSTLIVKIDSESDARKSNRLCLLVDYKVPSEMCDCDANEISVASVALRIRELMGERVKKRWSI